MNISAEYKNMVKVWLAVIAPLCNGNSNNFKFIQCVTDCIFITNSHSHTETVLKYTSGSLSPLCHNVDLFLPYCNSHSQWQLHKIHSLLHYIECNRETSSANDNDTEIFVASHQNLIKDGFHSFNNVY